MQAGRSNEIRAVDRRDGLEIRAWRRRARLTRQDGARELEVSERMLAHYEDGTYPVPKRVLLAVRHLANTGDSERSLGRERWVKIVDALLRYGRGEPVVGHLLKARRLDDLADLLEFARRGPDPGTAMSDPALFRALREASTRMYMAGLFALPELRPARLRDLANQAAEEAAEEPVGDQLGFRP